VYRWINHPAKHSSVNVLHVYSGATGSNFYRIDFSSLFREDNWKSSNMLWYLVKIPTYWQFITMSHFIWHYNVCNCDSVVKLPQIQHIQWFFTSYYSAVNWQLFGKRAKVTEDIPSTCQLSPFSVKTDCNFGLHLRYTRAKC